MKRHALTLPEQGHAVWVQGRQSARPSDHSKRIGGDPQLGVQELSQSAAGD